MKELGSAQMHSTLKDINIQTLVKSLIIVSNYNFLLVSEPW